MTTHEKALEAHRLTKEIVEEAQRHEHQKIAGLFRTFGAEFTLKTELLVMWTKPLEKGDS